MADLETQLQRYADQVEASVAPSSLPAQSPRRRWIWGAVAAVLLGVVAAGAAWALQSDDEPDVETDVISEPDGGVPVSCPEPEPDPQSGVEVEQVSVPSVITLYYDTAEQTLRNLGLVPVPQFRTVPFGDPQVGLVIEQNPGSFALVDEGSEVIIVVGEVGPEEPDE